MVSRFVEVTVLSAGIWTREGRVVVSGRVVIGMSKIDIKAIIKPCMLCLFTVLTSLCVFFVTFVYYTRSWRAVGSYARDLADGVFP